MNKSENQTLFEQATLHMDNIKEPGSSKPDPDFLVNQDPDTDPGFMTKNLQLTFFLDGPNYTRRFQLSKQNSQLLRTFNVPLPYINHTSYFPDCSRERDEFFLYKRLQFTYVQATGEGFSPQKRTKWNLLNFLYLWVTFDLLDPDPDSQSGSRSRDPI